MAITRFEDIEGWRIGRKLTQLVYRATKSGEFSKDYGLKDQVRRASGSIMHNIAEGFDGGSDAEFAKFLRYAQRSCSEVQSQFYIALDQSYVDENTFAVAYELADHAHSKIGGLIAYLVSKATRNQKGRGTKHEGRGTNF